MRAQLATRIATVSGFLKTLTKVIDIDANAEAAPVLVAMKTLPQLLRSRHHLTVVNINEVLIHRSWKRLVLGAQPSPDAAVDKASYVTCVLTQFHRHLKRGNIYAGVSGRWRDPKAPLLDGQAWTTPRRRCSPPCRSGGPRRAAGPARRDPRPGLPGFRLRHGRQRRDQYRRRRQAARGAPGGHIRPIEPGRAAQASRHDAAPGRPARGHLGGDGLVPGFRGGVRRRVGRPEPLGGPARKHRLLPEPRNSTSVTPRSPRPVSTPWR